MTVGSKYGKKVYAVRVGHRSGIYKTWAECQKYTKGFSGAEFKSFKTMEEAETYMNGGAKPILEVDDVHVVKAYVDGSYDHSTLRYAGGAVILFGEDEIHLSEAGDNENLASMRNVAGELLGGAIRSMEWYEENYKDLGTKKLVIYHDYEGIAKWATGAWKAKKEGTIAYVERYKTYEQSFPIEFVKVLAHSGDHYNEIADQLAKRALGLID